ncbi:hypothetical protein NQ318_005437 [Aromia moschata]|uniref:Uncharacterized protein n=1 Tax=Aromia moschata TaxID=1265417 RepID=A0AAV8YWE8_9CUCU|nr:hypothetical protein NQ318_005437 [Aromia moschata]
MSADINGAKEERVYFLSVVSTFKSYREQSLLRIRHKEKCLETLPWHHKKWLTKYREDLDAIKSCIEKNSELLPVVLNNAHTIFDNVYSNETSHSEQEVGTCPRAWTRSSPCSSS